MKSDDWKPGQETVQVLREAIARAPATLDVLPISQRERTYMKSYVKSLQAVVDRCDRIAPQHQRMKARSGAATKKTTRK